MFPEIEVTLRDPNRLGALRDLALLDSAAEPAFDRLTRLATKLLRVPTALVSLVDEDRQFFKSCVGVAEPWNTERQTPLSHSFCQYAVVMDEPFIVEDARVHPLVSDNLAIRDLDVISYAGIPLVTSEGMVIGTFCAIDNVPREWSDEDIATLRDLTSMVITEIELRSEITERQRMEREREELLARERQARAEAEHAQQQVALLSDASKVLASSLSTTTGLNELTHVLSCSLADWCEIYMLDEAGQLQGLGTTDREQQPLLLPEALRTNPFDPQWANHPVLQVLSCQVPLFLPELSAADLEMIVGSDTNLALVRGLQPKSLISVAIQTSRQVYGLLLLMATYRNQPLNAADLELAEEIGRRAGLAVDTSRLYQEALNAVRARNNVLAVVTHDLRSPLHIMQLYTAVLQQRLNKADVFDSVIDEAAAQIGGAGEKMSKLVHELMDVAVLQYSQTIELNCSTTDLVATIQRVVQQQQQTTQRHYLRVESALTQLITYADLDRIERVIANLVNNAVKYSPHGGEIIVTIACQNDDTSGWAIITVEDHGLGIPSADLPHIFEQFYRAQNVPPGLRGMGLGLASAQQIIERHGGTITVVSTEGMGTRFTVGLPIIRP